MPKEQDQKDIAEIFDRAKATALKKNLDYGSSVFLSGILSASVPPEKAILVRMDDKIKRIQNLMGREDQALVNESLDDTMQDLAVYCFLWCIHRQRQRHEREKKSV